MRRERRWESEGRDQLRTVRLLILFGLFVLVVSLLPNAWKAWVFEVAMVAILCGSIIAIFLAGRIKPPPRRRRPRPEPKTPDLEDDAMEWESQRRY